MNTGERISQIIGNYKLVRLLGKGGFSDVYLGEHIHLNTLAAIKVLHSRLAKDDDTYFRTEARTLARLIHPNIVRLLDFGIEQGNPFLIMDYAPNGSLRQRHPRGSLLSLDIIIPYVKQVASALQYAHDQKVIHRNVKPENMLIGRGTEILLSDFGIPSLAQGSESERIQDVTGSVMYMAPEYIQGKPRSASDQYALGVVVYEWLTGKPPFEGNVLQVMYQHVQVAPPPSREKVPGISPDVENVVMTALAKDPKDRFVTVTAFATALEQASWPGRTVLAEPYSSSSSQQSSNYNPMTPANQSARPFPPYPLPAQSSSPYQSPSTLSSSTPPSPPPSYGQPSYGTPLNTIASQSSYTRPESVLSEIPQTRRPVSRRTVLVGLLGLGTIAAAEIAANGGITRLWASRGPNTNGTTPLPNSIGSFLIVYRGHSDKVFAATWSPDGRYIASGSADKTVQVWDAFTGDHRIIYTGHLSSVNTVAWSPDGTHIASGGADKTVQVWDAHDGNHILTYRGHLDGVLAVAWSPNGKRIASGSLDKTVQVWDAADGSHAHTYSGHADSVNAVAWSPDGRYMASGSADKTVQVWDASTANPVFTYRGHSDTVAAVAWSPDGKRIASGSFDKTVQTWDALDGNHILTYRGHLDGVLAVAWSPNGKHIASGGRDKTVKIWDALSENKLFTYKEHTLAVNSLTWSPDSKYIASASDDGTVRVWQAV